jgi:hypothetical protein
VVGLALCWGQGPGFDSNVVEFMPAFCNAKQSCEPLVPKICFALRGLIYVTHIPRSSHATTALALLIIFEATDVLHTAATLEHFLFSRKTWNKGG